MDGALKAGCLLVIFAVVILVLAVAFGVLVVAGGK